MARKKSTPVAAAPTPIIIDGKIALPGDRTVTPDIVEKTRAFAKGINIAYQRKMERRFLRTLKRAGENFTPFPPACNMNSWQLTMYEKFIAEAKQNATTADKNKQLKLAIESMSKMSEDNELSSSASTSKSVHLVQPPEHPVDDSPPASTHTLAGDPEPELEQLLSNDSTDNGKKSPLEWWKQKHAEKSGPDSVSTSGSTVLDDEGQAQKQKELAELSRRMELEDWQHKVNTLLEDSSDEEEDQRTFPMNF